jgi:hypothetical protein
LNFVSATGNDHREEMKQGETRKSAVRRKWSILVFVIGAAIGMALVGVSVYADFESSLFDIAVVSEGTIRPIYCPVFLDVAETGQVSATFSNRTDEIVDEMLVRAHISKGHLIWMREVENRLELAPGEKQRLFWDVTAEDAAYNHLILAKVIVMGSQSEPKDKGSCGVVVLDLPGKINGAQFFWVLFSVAIIFMLLGAWLWLPFGRAYSGRRLEATRSIVGLSILITIGLICSATGLWELAAVSFYISVLMIGVVVPHFLITRGSDN